MERWRTSWALKEHVLRRNPYLYSRRRKGEFFGPAERMSAFQKRLCSKFFIQKPSLKLLKYLSHCMMNCRYNMVNIWRLHFMTSVVLTAWILRLLSSEKWRRVV
jgi:hypothetical protein